jgi:hypothetical protein
MCDAVTTPVRNEGGRPHALEICEGHLELNRLSLVVDRELEESVPVVEIDGTSWNPTRSTLK